MVAEHVEEMRKRSAEMDDKLSAGTYAMKQIRNTVINFAGLGAGGVAGWHLGKLAKADGLIQRLGDRFGHANGKTVGAVIGAFVGNMVAVLVLGYEHWAKAEAQRLAVDEINKDIAEARLRMNPELVRENNALREIVAKQDAQLKGRQPGNTVAKDELQIKPSTHAQGEQVQVG